MASLTLRLRNGQWITLQDIDDNVITYIVAAATTRTPDHLDPQRLGHGYVVFTTDIQRIEIDL